MYRLSLSLSVSLSLCLSLSLSVSLCLSLSLSLYMYDIYLRCCVESGRLGLLMPTGNNSYMFRHGSIFTLLAKIKNLIVFEITHIFLCQNMNQRGKESHQGAILFRTYTIFYQYRKMKILCTLYFVTKNKRK